MLVYSASDLAWGVRVKSTAEALGLPARPVRTLQMLEDRLLDSPVRALIVDLDHPDQDFSLALIRRAAAANAGPGARGAGADNPTPAGVVLPRARVRVLAFSPHVHRELMQAARDAGAHEVMPRGAFAANLPEILIKLSAD